MQQIADWLEKLGMSEYAERFAENGIDFSVLRDLTDQDLERHRRRRSGIGGKCCARLRSLPVRSRHRREPALAEPKPQDTAERRQVTVMFSDLVGSTALSARMDPEDLREVISAYQKCVAETVRRFGGFVAKYMGDGVLDIFRLSAGARGRRRAGGASGAGVGRGGERRSSRTRSPANARRHCDRAGGCRRPDRIG